MSRFSISAAIAFAQAAPAIDEPALDIAAARALPALALVACSAGKARREAAAADLYTSDLFRKSRAYAEQLGGPWRILSAAHHLVRPETRLRPYDRRLDQLTPADRRQWASLVANLVRVQGFSGRRVVMLAGDLYRRDLTPLLEALGCAVEAPMAGLGIGRQKQWLARAIAPGVAR